MTKYCQVMYVLRSPRIVARGDCRISSSMLSNVNESIFLPDADFHVVFAFTLLLHADVHTAQILIPLKYDKQNVLLKYTIKLLN